jgi:hypothetical protein
MEKYRLVQETKPDESDEFLDHHAAASSSSTDFPEVRITQQGKPRNYISYAMNLFVRTCGSVRFRFVLISIRVCDRSSADLVVVSLSFPHFVCPYPARI